MADIKFMDISENDNPATTDSILVGNQDNGLKRTTLGKLSDMFAVHGLFHFETVSSIVKAETICYPIVAPVVEGYKFAFWLNSLTSGWTGSTYIDAPTSSTPDIWIAYPTDSHGNAEQSSTNVASAANGVNAVAAVAVYIKNSVA